MTTALAASAGTTTRATILAAPAETTTTGATTLAAPTFAAVDLALQSGWGTDETESNPGPAGPIVIGIAPSGMTDGPARRHDRLALRRPAERVPMRCPSGGERRSAPPSRRRLRRISPIASWNVANGPELSSPGPIARGAMSAMLTADVANLQQAKNE